MITITNFFDTDITYYSRYDIIDRWEILDHNSRVVDSGETYLVSVDGKISHTICYNYLRNGLYTYKAYYQNNLANQSLIRYITSEREDNYIKPTTKNTFITPEIISGTTIDLSYYSRYNNVDKWEILDHNSRIVTSGLTNLTAIDGKIHHTGLTYNYTENGLYTYKSYFENNLSNQSLLKYTKNRIDLYKVFIKERNVYKTKAQEIIVQLIDGGAANTIYTQVIDGGSASSVGCLVIDAGVA